MIKITHIKIIYNPLTSASFSLFRYTDLPTEEYVCPVLRGCTVCVTGLSSAERKEVQRLCERHGANYTGQLKMNECTHLIVSEPTGKSPTVQASIFSLLIIVIILLGKILVLNVVTSPLPVSFWVFCLFAGQKYECARKWNVYCVTLHWLFDSIEKGFCQDESRYKVDRNAPKSSRMQTSTPTGTSKREGEPRSFTSLLLLKQCDWGRAQQFSCKALPSCISRPVLYTGMNVCSSSLEGASLLGLSHISVNASVTISDTVLSNGALSRFEAPDPIDRLDLSVCPADDILDGCKVNTWPLFSLY